MRNVHKTVVGKLEGKSPHGRPMCRWEDNISIDLKKSIMTGIGLDLSDSGKESIGRLFL